MLERLRRRPRDVDPRQTALQGILDQIEAGPQIIELKHKILDREGEVVPPQGLTVDLITGNASLEIGYRFPPANEGLEGSLVSVGATQTETGETVVYVASDGQAVFQSSPYVEGLRERIRAILVFETARRVGEHRMPQRLLNRFSPVANGPTG